MPRIEKRVQVDTTIERLFSYMPDAPGTLEIWPGLLEIGEVEYLVNGGIMARWIYRSSGAIFPGLPEWNGPLVERRQALTQLGDIACQMKWHCQLNVGAPCVVLDGVHTLWSQN